MAGPTTARRGEKKPGRSRPPASGKAGGSGGGGGGGKSGKSSGPKNGGSALRGRFRLPPRRVLIITLAGAALLAGFGAWALYGSTWLRTEEVKATGTKVLTADEVVRAAAVPMDVPLASVDKRAIAERLRAELPRIKSVVVSRSWPHTVSLKVTEREPELLIQTGGKFVEVDAEGTRFATVATAPKGVPLLEMAVRDSPSLRRFGADRLRGAAATVVTALPKAVHQDVRTVQVRSYDSITLRLTNGRTVVWGSEERSTAKAKVLTAALKAARDARHFDVSVPTAPAVSGS
ncbi:FtsQ-type POTRA domain-containing protein [Streptomyces albofaciens JCM 4342]|uniref:cell division protein FtsQ/DivIB n=1 Tax=Streptomyces albofaciens TaxID=66866 RepID=UPI00123BBC76|nr:FtsQ-type POTRA domain-containing protein [Streptomyces albofaciens]KAA6222414.1 FtsQ-type POTRA domain-containing protein [Streptomyces albofaciens JCM 4342]